MKLVLRLPAAVALIFFLIGYCDVLVAQEWDEPTLETHKLTASDGASFDNFGSPVAASGDLVLVAAPGDDSAYFFRYDSDADEWVEEQKITVDGSASDDFGGPLALSGDVALVGAPGDNSAFVFRYDSDDGEWVEEQQLTASDGEVDDSFSVAVALSDDVALVGAYREDSEGLSFGSVYVFRYNAADEEWVEEQKLAASDEAADDLFGGSLALSDDVALVGAPGDDDNAGSAYIFRYNAAEEEWLEEQKLTASDTEELNTFGTVALSGEVALIGAFGFNGEGTVLSSAYVFRYDPDTEEWVEEQKLTASDGDGDDWYGYSVALTDDVALVGAFQSDSAYLYRYDSDDAEWVEEQKFATCEGVLDVWFSFNVAMAGDVAFVSAHLDDDRVGSLYVFHFEDPEATFLRADCDGNGVVEPITDPLYSLTWAFLNGPEPPCLEAADTDDNGVVEVLIDPMYSLAWAFLSGPAPPDPGTDECGLDPDCGKGLGCEVQSDCDE